MEPKADSLSTYQQPWSVVTNAELTRLRRIEELARELRRGCDCEYDYRCENCKTICQLRDIV